MLTIHKALQLRDDMKRLYGKRKEGGRGFDIIEGDVDAAHEE